MSIIKIKKTDEEWQKILTAEQFLVMRRGGTERPFTCEFIENKKKEGTYHCVACNLPLFKAGVKFESGTGWPSFYEPYEEGNLLFERDYGFGMERMEVKCARCESHLGHVFDDGPAPSGKRYCINGVALKFEKQNRLV